MFDSIKKIAEERLKRKQARKEDDKLANRDMLDSSLYEDSMGLPDLMKKKKEKDEEG